MRYRVTIYLLLWVTTKEGRIVRRWMVYAKRNFSLKKQAVKFASYMASTKSCRKVSLQRLPKKNEKEGY